MKFMFSWKLRPGCHKPAAEAFLQSQAPMPEGLNVIGRWHAPGSATGWLVAEADTLEPVTLHAAEWANLLEIDITPVVDDEAAGKAFSAVYG